MFSRFLAYAPLAPFAVTATLGLSYARVLGCAIGPTLLVAVGGIGGWLMGQRTKSPWAIVGLWFALGALAATYHQLWREHYPASDIGAMAQDEPTLLSVRGILVEEPTFRPVRVNDPLVSVPRHATTTTILEVHERQTPNGWQPTSGRVRLTVEGHWQGFHMGDECELFGWLSRPLPPQNPGGWDYAAHLRDQRIRAEVRVRHSPATIVRLQPAQPSLARTLLVLRGWAQRGLDERLIGTDRALASALLLGDTMALTNDEWERYIRTGVIHVLAISGQHLVILGAFLWFVMRLFGVPRRPSAVLIAVVLFAYALLTGGRPSALRAAVMVAIVCTGVLQRRHALNANTFALAWLVVLAINPTDLFTLGFQVSFLCVAVLAWGIPRWFPPHEPTPLEQLIDESRPVLVRWLRQIFFALGRMYRTTAILAVASAPLIMYWQNLVSPAGIVIGPWAIILTTVGLISGFLLLLVWPIGVLAQGTAWLTSVTLAWCDRLVVLAERFPSGCWYVGQPPLWWLVGFYGIGIAWLVFTQLPDQLRSHGRAGLPILLAGWSLLGLGWSARDRSSDELRVTFLAVEHGACVVMELPDGRVLLYDVGTNAGPDATKRHVAPYLWSRGHRHIDEVFLSHADLDHFNGLPPLLDRFTVGRITYTPTFASKPSPGVQRTLATIEAHGCVVRIAQRGDHLTAGNVTLDVLHPPSEGPVGEENARSLVLLIRHEQNTILLTGDLEKEGLREFLQQPATPVSVLMAPHHGSVGQQPEQIAELGHWAKPRLVVSCQGRGDAAKAEAIFRQQHIPYWGTWPHGAITIRSHASGIVAETYGTQQRLAFPTAR